MSIPHIFQKAPPWQGEFEVKEFEQHISVLEGCWVG